MCVSVSILCMNEEVNLADCLKSVSWSDDVVVFDSFSSDKTVEIAETAGARVFSREFDNYAAQRNAALNSVQYKHPWVLMLDADERVSKGLREEIAKLMSNGSDKKTALYRMRRKDIFLGKWLRRSSGYPVWFGRLIRVGNVRVVREVNEEYHTNGEIGHLSSHLIHYPFNKGIAFWLERHNRYSSMEANALVKETESKLKLRDALSSDPTVRRKLLKQVAFRIPCRPFVVFCYLYFFRLGFLDGAAGFTYCRLKAIYEYMIDLKVNELRHRE